jgi:3-phosphoshikimate 1-carboxyvinyltransferase
MMLLKTIPSAVFADNAKRDFFVPGSKPETQRAILIGSLANGTSTITHDLRCRETAIMKRAAQALGAVFIEDEERLAVVGVSLRGMQTDCVPVIRSEGSGLVARTFAVLGTVRPGPLVVTGDDILCGREMRPLFEVLNDTAPSLEYIGAPYHLPVLVHGGGLKGGEYELPGDVSSQFITALLIGAPMAESPVTIRVRGTVLSGSYLRQTIAAMKLAGVTVQHDDDLKWFHVPEAEYQPFSQHIAGDYTSASYFLLAAALSEGTTVLRNISKHSLQGEREIVNILEEIGVTCSFDSESEILTVKNNRSSFRGNYEFDISDCPNIAPTLAALGSYVNGRFRVIGASITRLHKSSRVDAMVHELRKLGVQITPISKNGVVDGFEVRGRDSYEGGQLFSSWRDHRIFMSLFVASLRHRNPNWIDGYADVDCSFPTFLEQFEHNGAKFETTQHDPALQGATCEA